MIDIVSALLANLKSILYICCGLALISFVTVMWGLSSCAGRDVCGSKYCLTGIISDYIILPVIATGIFSILSVVLGLFWLFKMVG